MTIADVSTVGTQVRREPVGLLDITVLAGGPGAEREVSLASGRAVYEALCRLGHRAQLSDIGPDDLLTLNDALDKFSAADPSVSELVRLHYFAGLTLAQIAVIQGISRRTAVKHLVYARAWLHRETSAGDEPDVT